MLIDVVREALDAEGWSYEVVAERGACVLSVSGRSTLYRCIAAADEALEQVAVLVVAPQRLPAPARVAACEYLMRVNFGLRIGSFDLDFSDGEFRFRTALDVEGGLLVPRMVQTMLGYALATMDVYHDGALRVAFGGVPAEEALAEARTVLAEETANAERLEAAESEEMAVDIDAIIAELEQDRE